MDPQAIDQSREVQFAKLKEQAAAAWVSRDQGRIYSAALALEAAKKVDHSRESQ